MKTGARTKTCTQMFMATLFIMDKKWKQLKCPLTDECVCSGFFFFNTNGLLQYVAFYADFFHLAEKTLAAARDHLIGTRLPSRVMKKFHNQTVTAAQRCQAPHRLERKLHQAYFLQLKKRAVSYSAWIPFLPPPRKDWGIKPRAL